MGVNLDGRIKHAIWVNNLANALLLTVFVLKCIYAGIYNLHFVFRIKHPTWVNNSVNEVLLTVFVLQCIYAGLYKFHLVQKLFTKRGVDPRQTLFSVWRKYDMIISFTLTTSLKICCRDYFSI